MKVLRLRATNLGPLEELDTGEGAPLPSLVVVTGRNEAGKSSFRAAATALFYGFYPATRDGNPLSPWSGGSPEVEGFIRRPDGETLEVRRRLLSRPDGTLVMGDRSTSLGNREVPGFERIDRRVFEQVYALGLPELAGLREEGWTAVQDRLVVGMGTTDLLSPREVAEALEKEAGSLWQPNRRKTPRHAVLKERLGELHERRREAARRDHDARALDRAVVEKHELLDDLRNERRALELERSRITRLHPLRGRLRRIAELTGAAGHEEDLEGLPADPARELRTLEERIADARDRATRTRRRLEEAEGVGQGPPKEDAELLARAGPLRKLADSAGVLQEKAVERGRIEAELDELDRRVSEVSGPLLNAPVDPEALATLSLDRLRTAVEELERTRRDLSAARASARTERERLVPEAGPAPRGALVLLGIGALLLVAALATGLANGSGAGLIPAGLLVGGAAAFALGGMLLAAWRERRRLARDAQRAHAEEMRSRTDRVRSLESEHARLVEETEKVLEPLPLHPARAGNPDPGIVRELERLRDLLLDRSSRARVAGRVAEHEGEVDRELDHAKKEVPGLADLPGEAVAALLELKRRLDASLAAEATARRARADAERLGEELADEQRAVEDFEGRRDELLERILEAGRSNVREEALRALRKRMKAREALDREWEELHRERPNLADERRELETAERRGEEWLDAPDAPDRIHRRISELNGREVELAEELSNARNALERLEQEETVDLVDGRIAEVEDELEQVAREHDRLAVLARVVRLAEIRFREAHQPDLLRRAGRYLERITDGRYTRFLLGEEGADAFLLDGENLPRPLPVEAPLSTGIREQAYLALRLAIVDHLDGDGPRLPLFLDEVLVNWDPERRARGLDVLAEVASTRQVFLLTCHPELVDAVAERGGRVLELPEGASSPAA